MGDSLSYLDLLLQVCRRGKKMFCGCDRFRFGVGVIFGLLILERISGRGVGGRRRRGGYCSPVRF